MSEASIRKNIVKRIKTSLEEIENLTVSRAARDILQSKAASQCLIFTDSVLHTLTEAFERCCGRPLEETIKLAYYKDLQDEISGWHKGGRLPLAIRNEFWNKHIMDGLTWRDNIVYTGTNYRTILEWFHRFNRKWALDRNLILKDGYDRKASNLELDHGVSNTGVGLLGIAGGGGALAAREVEGNSSFGSNPKERWQYFESEFNQALEEQVNIKFAELSASQRKELQTRLRDVVVNWKQFMYKNGKFKASIGVAIVPLDKDGNQSKSGFEAREINAITRALAKTFNSIGVKNYLEMKGSGSGKEKIEKHLSEIVLESAKVSKNIKTKYPSNRAKRTTKTKVKERTSKRKGVKPAPAKKVKLPRGTVRPNQGTTTEKSLFSAMNLINAGLHDKLKDNMVEPALVYRTGRFAQSVQVVGVSRTPGGYPRFDYTYQRNPYDVFSPQGAAPWNVPPDRWPEIIIDRSIRDIATELALGRFFTRRV